MQVLVPSESKTLHLFEARYLGLLEESFIRKKRLFVHFILDPVVISSTSEEASFSARYGCLVQIEKVERLDVGALVSIRGIGRVTIVKFEQKELEIQMENNLLENLLMKGSADVRNVDNLCNVLDLLDEKLSFVNLEISKRVQSLEG
ncbi:hypothetical protein LguiA_018029 [Lonicera macranthoides]